MGKGEKSKEAILGIESKFLRELLGRLMLEKSVWKCDIKYSLTRNYVMFTYKSW